MQGTKHIRRGWRETVEPGIYRAHRLACPSSTDQKPKRRCDCPFQVKVPGSSPGTTRMVTVVGTISEARAERRRLMSEGRPTPAPETWHGTLRELAADYLRTRAPILAPATVYTVDESFRLRIDPALGHLRPNEINRERLEVWLADLTTTATSPRMVTKTVEALRVILQAAVTWGRIPSNPAMGLRLPTADTHERQAVERVLTAQQLRTLFTQGARSARHETLLRAAGEGGLRRGEIIALRWPDVRFDERRLDVRRSVWEERASRLDGAPPVRIEKTTKGRRARRVAISPTFAALLVEWYEKAVVEGGADAGGYVWPGKDGGPMAADSPTQLVERSLRRCGLIDQNGRPLVSLHGLRHTAGSIMLAAGVPLIVVSRQLGHANPQITAQVYAHLLADEQLDIAAGALEALLATDTVRETVREDVQQAE